MPILIVDDTKLDIMIASAMVKPLALRDAVGFQSAEGALAWCQTHKPRLAVVDYAMPAMDGFEFVRRLRAVPACVATPVLMMTSADIAPIMHEALTLGIFSLVPKPLDARDFRRRIVAMLSN